MVNRHCLLLLFLLLAGRAGCAPAEGPSPGALPPEPAPTAGAGELLPEPGGPQAVATTVYHWLDESRLEGATEDAADHRQLIVQVWYPAGPPASPPGELFPFFPDLEAYQQAFGAEAYPDSLGAVPSHSRTDAPPAGGPPFPVLVFFHGWNSRRSAYTSLLEDLASRGYAVVGVDQPWAGRVALPDGSVTPSRDDHFASPEEMLACYGEDFRLVVRKLAELDASDRRLGGRLDLGRLGVFGHSNGGISAAQASRLDPRVGAVVLLDSFSAEIEFLYQLEKPLLLVRTGGAEAPSEGYLAQLKAVVYDLELLGGNHLSATDFPLLEADGADQRRRALELSAALKEAVAAFFDRHLRERDLPFSIPPHADLRLHTPRGSTPGPGSS